MKREELKAVDYDTIYANLPYINMLFYIATEADNVMDEMEQHIKELEEANKLAVIVGNKQAGRIKELEAENKALRQANLDCNAHFNTLKEDYEKLKRTKRALWLARAERAKWVSENADAFKDYCDRHPSSHFHTYDGKMHFYEWTWKWELAERKCRDHADMFKED